MPAATRTADRPGRGARGETALFTLSRGPTFFTMRRGPTPAACASRAHPRARRPSTDFPLSQHHVFCRRSLCRLRRWHEPPIYLIPDRTCVDGEVSRERVAANGRPLGRGGVGRDTCFSPSTRVG